MQNCWQCNYQNPEGTKFCQQCGYPLIPTAPSPLAQTAYPEPVPQMPTPKKGLTYFEKWALVGSVLVILLIIGAFASMSYSPSRTAPTPATPSWHTVSSYSGSGYDSNGVPAVIDTNTTTFSIKGSSFRLNWSYTTNYAYNQLFAVYDYPSLYFDPSHGTPLPVICQTSDTTTASYGCNYTTDSRNSGTKNLNQGPGSFYLQVIGFVGQWSITVEDYY